MDAERYAEIFARAATTGERAELAKVASEFTKVALTADDLKGALGNPAVQNALIGAGVGGLFGAATGKKKLRSALGYGLAGAAGGLGVSALTGALGGEKSEAPAGLTPEQRGAISTGTGNPRAAAGIGAGIGGVAGYNAGGAVGDAMAKREGQISRFLNAGLGKDKHRFAEPLQRLEKFGPGGTDAVEHFKLDALTAPAGNRFARSGMAAPEAAGQAVDDVAKVMNADRLSYLPWRRTKQLDALTKVMQAEGNAATRINPKALANALDDLPARATSRMPRMGRGAGALLGLLLGGMSGARANRSAVLNAQQQAAGAQ